MNVENIGNFEGSKVFQAGLESNTGVEILFMSYGAILRDWKVPVHHSKRSVVLGFKHLESYLKDTEHIGAIVGRVANRIRGARFTLNGKTYQLPANVGANHLHGGPKGLSRQNWTLDTDSQTNSVILSLHSPSGNMGYPGDVKIKAVYSLKDYKLSLKLSAEVSEPTPLSLVQHHYFNLSGEGSILDHQVQVDAAQFTPLSEELVPTGEFQSVTNTIYDLRHAKVQRTAQGDPQAYDINYVLNPHRDRYLDTVAIVQAPDKSLQLKLYTDQPGLQFYNGYYLNIEDDTLSGKPYVRHTGLCLEDQQFPDALNHRHFPSIIVEPGKAYHHECEIEIKPP